MDERHLKILREIWDYQKRTGTAPRLTSFSEDNTDVDVNKTMVQFLDRKGLVEYNGDIVLTHNGIDKLQDYLLLENIDDLHDEIEKNREFNQKLMEQEKRSSAVETLFTITLVAFSFVQISTLLLRGQPTNSEYLTTIMATIGMIAVTYVALEINGDNLEEVVNQTDWSIPFLNRETS